MLGDQVPSISGYGAIAGIGYGGGVRLTVSTACLPSTGMGSQVYRRLWVDPRGGAGMLPRGWQLVRFSHLPSGGRQPLIKTESAEPRCEQSASQDAPISPRPLTHNQACHMDTDCHGIAHQFQDAFGVLRVTSRSTRDAIRRAMHAEEPFSEPRVRVVNIRRKSGLRVGSGKLVLEDGGSIDVSDRLPADVPLGYHDLFPLGGGAPIRLIVSPGRCPAPPAKKSWGWAVQLYAARSAESWGMGIWPICARWPLGQEIWARHFCL